MNVLVGDIGGTKTILAVFSSATGAHQPLFEKTYHSSHYETFEVMVREFLDEAFGYVNLDWHAHVKIDPRYFEHFGMPNEVKSRVSVDA